MAGKIVDRVGGGKLLLTTAVMYTFYTSVFAFVSDPILYSILWIVPIWAFNWVAALATPAQMTTEKVRGEAMGAINTALNFGVFVGVTGGLFADRFTRELGVIVSPCSLQHRLLPCCQFSIFQIESFHMKLRS